MHILDYLKKRNLHETASSFKQECKVSEKPRGESCPAASPDSTKPTLSTNASLSVFAAIDAPSGFLFEWWTIFWDIYIARTNPAFSEYASTYSEVKAMLSMHQPDCPHLC